MFWLRHEENGGRERESVVFMNENNETKVVERISRQFSYARLIYNIIGSLVVKLHDRVVKQHQITKFIKYGLH